MAQAFRKEPGTRLVTKQVEEQVTRLVTKQVVEQVPGGLSLELDDEEAKVLTVLLARVGGKPDGLRGVVDRIRGALVRADYDATNYGDHDERRDMFERTGHSIYFRDGARIPR